MISEDKVTDFFCMADDFCKFFWCNDSKIYAKTYRKKEISSKFYRELKNKANSTCLRFTNPLKTFPLYRQNEAYSP